MKKHNCVVCDKEIEELYSVDDYDDYNSSPDKLMWDQGVVTETTAGFGSKYDMSKIIIAICDDCIKNKNLKIKKWEKS